MLESLKNLTELLTVMRRTDASVAAEKFQRFQNMCSKKVINAEEVEVPAANESSLLHRWHPVVQEIDCPTEYVSDPYAAEIFLVEGTAEVFNSCKLNPVDEFKQVRQRRLKESRVLGGTMRFTQRKSA